MEKHQNKSIYHILIQIAHGNLNYQINLENQNSEYNRALRMLIKFKNHLKKSNYRSPYDNSGKLNKDTEDKAYKMVQDILNYIHNHHVGPLPSTKELSKMFGTNEFTLKANFRNALKTSIYQYYQEGRLKKAHLMIETTNIPIKEIAEVCGFLDYGTFSKAFKKKFNYPPGNLKRKI